MGLHVSTPSECLGIDQICWLGPSQTHRRPVIIPWLYLLKTIGRLQHKVLTVPRSDNLKPHGKPAFCETCGHRNRRVAAQIKRISEGDRSRASRNDTEGDGRESGSDG